MNKLYLIHPVRNAEEKQDAMTVRRRVFIEEQQVPEEIEIDLNDEAPKTIHFVAYADEKPVGASRLRTYAPGIGKVERVAVLGSERGTGLGRKIMEVMEETARQHGYTKLKLNAQTHAQVFYEKLGYSPFGEIFEEAGIEHIAMEKLL